MGRYPQQRAASPSIYRGTEMKLTMNLPGIPPRTSDVIIGEGLLQDLPTALRSYLEGRVAYWIWDENVWNLWKERIEKWGWGEWLKGHLILFPASEPNKRLAAVEELGRQLAVAGADRESALVAVGGGVTGDVVGFLASIYMRGIPHFQVPTTLLAQVDSSVGGKTGVDLPEGKNLLGTFHQPGAIWMDAQFLETLPDEQLRQGMAEVIKTAMIGDEVLWKYLESHNEAIKKREREALVRVVTACCIIKAKVVESDERESGYRRILNLGHTVGHALERLSEYRIRHGDAVAMGMVVAAKLALKRGLIIRGDLDRLEKLCEAWELPVRIPPEFSPKEIIFALKTDKKRVGKTLHFILPVRIGEVMDCDDLDMGELEDALASLRGK